MRLTIMMKVIIYGAGAAGAYFAGKQLVGHMKKNAPQGPMEIVSKGFQCVQSNVGPFCLQDLMLGLAVLAKTTEKELPPAPGQPVEELAKDPKFLAKMQHWRAHVEGSYGKSAAEWSLLTHLPEGSIIASQWFPHMESMRPAHVVSIDPPFGAVVVAVRGTQDVSDMLCNAGAHPEDFEGGQIHSGFLRAANELMKEIEGPIETGMEALQETCGGRPRLVLVGHSLGAAVAVACGYMLRGKYPDVQVVGLGPPACMSLELAKRSAEFVTCFIAGHDLVPRFSLANVERLRQRILDIDWKRAEQDLKGDEDFANIKKAADTFTRMHQTQQAAGRKLQEVQRGAGDKVQEMQRSISGEESKDGEEDSAKENGGKGAGDGDEGKGGHAKENGKGHGEGEEAPPPDHDGGKEGGKGEREKKDEPLMLHPPGKLYVLTSDPPGQGKLPENRDGLPQQRSLGTYPDFEESKHGKWVLTEARQEDFDTLIVSAWCISDHMPGVVFEGLSYLQRHAPPLLGWED
eukprot:jgi/Mesen1/1761/ME000014S01171